MGNRDTKRSSHVRCVFVPYWGSGNPYQDQLASSLEAQGVEVEKTDSLKTAVHKIALGRSGQNVVHLHWLPSFSLRPTSLLRLPLFVCRLLLLRLFRIKIVWTVHNLRPHESEWPRGDWLAAKVVAALANAIIVHTETGAGEVRSAFRLKNKGRIVTIPHGHFIGLYDDSVDRTTARDRLAIPHSKVLMLSLGTIRPYKGVLELIRAFKVLEGEREEIGLMIAGKPASDELRRVLEAEVVGHENIYYRPGFVAPEDVQLYMKASDICVFPYHEILTSGAVILAMSFGRACIAPALGDIPENLGSAGGGFLYDPNDPSGLLGAMRQAVTKRAELDDMGQYNRAQAMACDWATIGEKTRQVYLSVLS